MLGADAARKAGASRLIEKWESKDGEVGRGWKRKKKGRPSRSERSAARNKRDKRKTIRA